MSCLTIKTNRNWREFTYREDVPAHVMADQFDWTDEAHKEHGDYSDGFFCYRGFWYHLGDFMRCEQTPGWDGSHGDSYFSGVLIKISDDGEQYQVGTYSC